jgi:hypothetical protein
MPDRLKPGQPPLRVKEFAVLCGVDPKTVKKWMAANELGYVSLPVSHEKRVPVDSAVALLRSLRVL